ncbi:MAG: CPBP family intramembrane glutamic endopeptidase [Acidobacteriota bacterium]
MSDLSLPEPVHADQALDVQHDTDPESDHSVARRIPHLGHALIFFSLTAFTLFGWSMVLIVIAMSVYKVTVTAHSPAGAYVGGLDTLFTYATTLGISFPLFPLLWQRSFLDGIHWVYRAARLRWWKLILLGVGLSLICQLADRYIVKSPAHSDVVELFRNPFAAYLTSIFGGIFIPLFEEVAFRGFLLPAFATAYDWLSLPRTPAAMQQWRQTTSHTTSSWIFSTFITSLFFVALHGFQLHWAWGALGVLFVPSVAFSIVRIRTGSVAAAALVHAAYDSLIFFEIFIQTGAFHHLSKLTS